MLYGGCRERLGIMMNITKFWMIVFCLSALTACGAPELPHTSNQFGGGVTVSQSSPEPWLIESGGDARAAISNQLSKGIALVRYDELGLELLPDCTVDGAYEGSAATSRPLEEKSISSESDIEAVLGIKLIEARGKFEKGERWSLKYTVADVLETGVHSVKPEEVPDGCEHATHYVSRAFLGAYILDTGATRRTEGRLGIVKIPIVTAETGGGSGGEVALVVSDGDYETCKDGNTPKNDTACQGLLKIGLRRIGE